MIGDRLPVAASGRWIGIFCPHLPAVLRDMPPAVMSKRGAVIKVVENAIAALKADKALAPAA
jgi:hypothetical protein